MARTIRKVGVMGAGTMGAGIAALCADKGAEVLLLDMPAREGERNAIAAGARARMTEGRAPMLEDPAAAERITVGNFADDMVRIAECDWIVEAVVEDLKIKRDLFTRLEAARRDGSILSTNTSGIQLSEIEAGMPDRLRRDVAVTHFFNPVKVMKLVELVPGADTEREVLDTLAAYLEGTLGKGVVWAKDTVNFVANRIGCFWMLAGMKETAAVKQAGLDIEDIDAAMGAPIGVPGTALYGLLDLVGLDVLGLVAINLEQNLPADDAGRDVIPLPAPMQAMLDRGQVGRKAGAGFYRMRQTDDGGRVKETFDLGKEGWRPTRTVELPESHRTLSGLLFAEDPLGRFAWGVVGGTLRYAADLVPEIADDIVNIDRAMRWGFAWKQGPFQMLDTLGPERVIGRIRAEHGRVPAMLQVLEQAGAETFYRADGREFLGHDGKWHEVP